MSEYEIPKLNPDAIKRAIANSNSSGEFKSDIKWHKLKNGPSYWCFLPPWMGNTTGENFYKLRVHFMKDDNGGTKAYKCSKEKHGSCPLCDSAYRLANDAETKKLGDGMKAQTKILYNAVSMETKEEGILSFGNSVDTHVLYELNLDMMAGKDPTNYDAALMVMIDKNEDWKKNKARGDSANRVNISSLKKNYPNLPKLDQVYEDYTPEELQMVLNGNYDPKNLRTKKPENQAPAKPDFPLVSSGSPVVANGFTPPTAPAQPAVAVFTEHTVAPTPYAGQVVTPPHAGFPAATPQAVPATAPQQPTQNLSPDAAYAANVLGI